jgi:predicted lipid-binding transport protein (Tim44 family)
MSGGDFQLFDILIFAAIAVFLFLRLRSVLGRRTGAEKRIDPFAPRSQTPPVRGPFAPPGPVIEGKAEPVAEPALGRTADESAVKAADPSFNEADFLKGARAAFGIVVNAFAAADTAALKPLLSPEVFESFAAAIKARGDAAKQPSPLVAIKDAEIASSAVEGTTALVTVKFVSDQNTGPGKVEEHTDVWTFARRLASRDPNWTLTATKSPDAA